MTTDTAARLAALERRVLGQATVTDAERAHPTGGGCHFCGLSFAVEADETGRCWFPPAPNEPDDVCLGCFLDAHALGFADTEWRVEVEHRDVVVSRLVRPDRADWELGLAAHVGWRWFHELDRREPHPSDRFAWVDFAALRLAADPPEHVCDETCPPRHRALVRLVRPEPNYGVTLVPELSTAGRPHWVFRDGPLAGQPVRFDQRADEWVPIGADP